MPWFSGEDLPVIGEIMYGNGGIITCAAPGYNWVSADTNGINEQNNLEMLTQNMLEYSLSYQKEQIISVSLMGGGNEVKEGEEDGKVIMVNFDNAILNDTINPSNWKVSNLPGSINYMVNKVDDANATLTLTGTPDDYMDMNITGFTIEVAKAEFINLRDTSLIDCGSIIFVADTTTDTTTSIEPFAAETLLNVYPNPFNGELTFDYEMPGSKYVVLEILDLNGRVLDKLVDEVQVGGQKEVKWNGINLPSGVYMYRLTVDLETSIGKIVKQ